jgi:hypothetical protein
LGREVVPNGINRFPQVSKIEGNLRAMKIPKSMEDWAIATVGTLAVFHCCFITHRFSYSGNWGEDNPLTHYWTSNQGVAVYNFATKRVTPSA